MKIYNICVPTWPTPAANNYEPDKTGQSGNARWNWIGKLAEMDDSTVEMKLYWQPTGVTLERMQTKPGKGPIGKWFILNSNGDRLGELVKWNPRRDTDSGYKMTLNMFPHAIDIRIFPDRSSEETPAPTPAPKNTPF